MTCLVILFSNHVVIDSSLWDGGLRIGVQLLHCDFRWLLFGALIDDVRGEAYLHGGYWFLGLAENGWFRSLVLSFKFCRLNKLTLSHVGRS